MNVIPRANTVTGTFSELVDFLIVILIPWEVILAASALSWLFHFQLLGTILQTLAVILTVVTVVWMCWFGVVWSKQSRTKKSRLGMWCGILSPLWVFVIFTFMITPGGFSNLLVALLACSFWWGIALLLAMCGLGSGFKLGKATGKITIFGWFLFIVLFLYGLINDGF